MSEWRMTKDDRPIRAYWGDEGWTYVMRTPDGKEYHISRTQIIKNKYLDIVEPKKKYAKHIYKNIYIE